MKKIAIITGATGGIGREFVKQILSCEIDEVWAVARNEQNLNGLRDEFGEKVIPVPADLSDMSGLDKLSSLLSEQKPQIRFLVNNAGLARMAPSKDFSAE